LVYNGGQGAYMKYNSKKDWWIGAIIWIPMLFGLYRMGYVSFVEDQSVLFFIIFAIFIGFVSWIWFGTYYVFDDEYLIVRCGPIKEIVLYKYIF
jgi:hypothetical protein